MDHQSSKPKVVFIPLSDAMIPEMLPVARRLRGERKYEPVFLPAKIEKFRLEKLQALEQEGYQIVFPPTPKKEVYTVTHLETGFASRKLSIWNSLISFVYHLTQPLIPRVVVKFLSAIKLQSLQVNEAKRMLDNDNVAGLVLIGDRHLGWETAFIKAANLRGIPSLIIPYAYSTPIAAVRLRHTSGYRDRFVRSSFLNWITSIIFPRWVYEYNGERLLFYQAHTSLAGWLTGTMPKNPWTIGGGKATRMAVESPVVYRQFLEQGISPEKMLITGKPSWDALYELLTVNKSFSPTSISDKEQRKRVVLLSVPHRGEHGLLSWERHWKEIDFLLSTLSHVPNTSVILSLHPISNPSNYEPLAQKYGATIGNEPYYKLLTICDIFVADKSSTILVAIGLAKPTILLGYLDQYQDFYESSPCVITIRAHGELKPTLEKLINDTDYYSRVVEKQRQEVTDWILLDGKCTERVVNELYRLIETSKPEPAGKNRNN
ncbi:MAG: hypothetical protein HPY45_07505 [Anaerolineae bacterium]|nr:hypothetical protein [Anaerolineae bacterium]